MDVEEDVKVQLAPMVSEGSILIVRLFLAFIISSFRSIT